MIITIKGQTFNADRIKYIEDYSYWDELLGVPVIGAKVHFGWFDNLYFEHYTAKELIQMINDAIKQAEKGADNRIQAK